MAECMPWRYWEVLQRLMVRCLRYSKADLCRRYHFQARPFSWIGCEDSPWLKSRTANNRQTPALPEPVFVVVANSFSCEMKVSMFADRRFPLMALVIDLQWKRLEAQKETHECYQPCYQKKFCNVLPLVAFTWQNVTGKLVIVPSRGPATKKEQPSGTFGVDNGGIRTRIGAVTPNFWMKPGTGLASRRHAF